MTTIRTGEAPDKLDREQFGSSFRAHFYDPSFAKEQDALARLEQIAWENYHQGRKAPITQKAGPGYADPDYDLSVEWIATRERLLQAAARQADSASPTRILVITGSARNDGSCPSEISKSWRMQQLVHAELETLGAEVDYLDLSLVTSSYGVNIHPCKGCVSTAMPLCHWPCSCYPNHAMAQTHDWMADIYERWTLAHGVILITPVYWYQSPSPLKLMIDRLVCADGGNPDPTSTHGKDPEQAKALELANWPYPKHLAGRAYGLAVHGDVAGIEGVRRALSDWLDWMGLVDAGSKARLDRYIGYYESYARSHEVFDSELVLHEEIRNVARAVLRTAIALRSGSPGTGDAGLHNPRPK